LVPPPWLRGKGEQRNVADRGHFQNGCVLHQAREVGELENYSFLHRVICLRFPGETECLWFVQETGFEVTLGSEGAARMTNYLVIQTALVRAKPAAATGYHMPLVEI
jgi:hypothetical protein